MNKPIFNLIINHFFILIWLTLNFFFNFSCTKKNTDNNNSSPPGIIENVSLSTVTPSSSFLLGGRTITLTGTKFDSSITVKIGDQNCLNVALISKSQITCTVPSVSMPATVNIQLNSFDMTVATLNSAFEYKSDQFENIQLISGSVSYTGSTDGVSHSAKFYRPSKPLVVGQYIYITDSGNHTIRRYNTSTTTVETIAGAPHTPGTTDGIGSAARFSGPIGLAHHNGFLYIADSETCLIRKMDLNTKQVTTIAGIANDCGEENPITDHSIGLNATFSYPQTLLTDGTYLYVGDVSYKIRRITLSGSYPVESLNMSATNGAILDLLQVGTKIYFIHYGGVNTDYKLKSIDLSSSQPYAISTLLTLGTLTSGMTTDGSIIYFTGQNQIRQYNISTLAAAYIVGTSTIGNLDGIGTSARLQAPSGLDYSSGQLYFTSFGTHNLRKVDISTLTVTTLAGNTK